jgi:multidrug resistance efflux pump
MTKMGNTWMKRYARSNRLASGEQSGDPESPGGQDKSFAPAGELNPSLSRLPRAGDAAALRSLLERHFDDAAKVKDGAGAPAQARPAASSWLSPLLKTLAGLVLIVAVGWMPAQRLFQVSSVEAVVNARLVTVRAPIAGTVKLDAGRANVGDAIGVGAPLVTVADPRVDQSRLNDLRQELGNAEQEREALSLKLDNLKDLRETLSVQLAAFHDNRLRQVEAEIAEADARIRSSLAEQARAEAVLARQGTLAKSGSISQSQLDDAERDLRVAIAALEEARARRDVVSVERDAINSGTYLGDDYNDQPRSAQRLDEVAQMIAAAEADMARLAKRIERAGATIRDEEQRVAMKSEARLAAPVAGRIWEVLTAPGEQVTAGQPLFSLLNCSDAIVTAVVSEAVYNSLSLGTPATFTWREGGVPLAGTVVQLSGVTSASSHFAIEPSALTGESYRVAVAVSGLAATGACLVGRTGRVVFQPHGS